MRDNEDPCCEAYFWVYLAISIGLVLFAGLTSGLSLGLLSHSKVDLEVLIKAGLPKHQKNAAKVLPLVKNECFLLCTLLIAKSLATEALPIFLDSILPFWAAIVVSVILVVAFVEVIPQTVCSRHGLSLGAKFTWFVRFLGVIFYPVSYPVSKILDCVLGESSSAIFRRAELKTLVDLHGLKAGKGGDLTDDETTIISGALGMADKTAKDAMTPLSKAFSLDINSKLDMHTMNTIASKGHSRIPIYSHNPANIVGLILVKNLIFYHPEDETPIKGVTMRRILRVYESWSLYDVLKLFQEGHGHMAVVVKSSNNIANDHENTTLQSLMIDSDRQQKFPSDEQKDGKISNEMYTDEEVIGIITMEDVLEELLQDEIRDETDHHVEIHDRIRVRFVPSRRSTSSLSSSRRIHHHDWITPATSFNSHYYHSPTTLPSSPITRPAPPVRSVSAVRNSFLLHQLSSISRHISTKSSEAF